jgi:hypothetical protein
MVLGFSISSLYFRSLYCSFYFWSIHVVSDFVESGFSDHEDNYACAQHCWILPSLFVYTNGTDTALL